MASAKKTSLIRPERHCEVCGKPFRPRRNQKFCSAKCRRASWSAANPLGLTLRQWYAGMAMQAIVSFGGYPPFGGEKLYAEHAFGIADAMIQHERDSK